jgi:hypothetical protein
MVTRPQRVELRDKRTRVGAGLTQLRAWAGNLGPAQSAECIRELSEY